MANPKSGAWYSGEAGLGEDLVSQGITFDGGAGTGATGTVALFTVTGAVIVRMIANCTTLLVEGVGGGTIEVGITGDTATLIAQTTATDIDANEIWHDATPDADIELLSVAAPYIIVNGMDIFATVAGQDITGGVINFYCFFTPLSSGATVVAA